MARIVSLRNAKQGGAVLNGVVVACGWLTPLWV